MKTTAHYLKNFLLFSTSDIIVCLSGSGRRFRNENEAVAGENKALKEKMVRFFLNYLSGDETFISRQ